eukprot:GEMP01100707.1.p1 GENE.GEMP01100707.1~~GEMP01100707.1.p1  ORF type:complete len:206 (-),score=11.24 GEMP01100707.1:94-711(-)
MVYNVNKKTKHQQKIYRGAKACPGEKRAMFFFDRLVSIITAGKCVMMVKNTKDKNNKMEEKNHTSRKGNFLLITWRGHKREFLICFPSEFAHKAEFFSSNGDLGGREEVISVISSSSTYIRTQLSFSLYIYIYLGVDDLSHHTHERCRASNCCKQIDNQCQNTGPFLSVNNADRINFQFKVDRRANQLIRHKRPRCIHVLLHSVA